MIYSNFSPCPNYGIADLTVTNYSFQYSNLLLCYISQGQHHPTKYQNVAVALCLVGILTYMEHTLCVHSVMELMRCAQ